MQKWPLNMVLNAVVIGVLLKVKEKCRSAVKTVYKITLCVKRNGQNKIFYLFEPISFVFLAI